MAMISKNIQLGSPLKPSSWRKIALGTWRTAGDPSVYAIVELDVVPALNYLEKLKNQTDQKLTLTHFVGKAMATVLERHPEINCILRLGKLYPRKTIDIFFQVASDKKGKDLSGITIRDTNRKSIPEIAEEMAEKVNSVRDRGDPGFKKMKSNLTLVPGFAMKTLLDSVGFFMYSLNLWSPLLGTPRDPFGSLMVTSIGSIGLEIAFAPLVPYSRVPMVMAIGAVQDSPVAREGKVVITKMSRICVTFDHRLIDGVHGANMASTFRKIFENPELELEGTLFPKTKEEPDFAPLRREPNPSVNERSNEQASYSYS